MANNLMKLVCKGCGESFKIAKVYTTLYASNVKGDYVERLNDFFENHYFCDENEHPTFKPSNETGFYLAYEHPNDSIDIEYHYKKEKNLEEFNKRLDSEK